MWNTITEDKKIKVSKDKAIRFFWDFDINKKFPNQRLGQAFMNHFGITGPDPELFYETDDRKSIDRIKEHYLSP